jgi:hypothetical protein
VALAFAFVALNMPPILEELGTSLAKGKPRLDTFTLPSAIVLIDFLLI